MWDVPGEQVTDLGSMLLLGGSGVGFEAVILAGGQPVGVTLLPVPVCKGVKVWTWLLALGLCDMGSIGVWHLTGVGWACWWTDWVLDMQGRSMEGSTKLTSRATGQQLWRGGRDWCFNGAYVLSSIWVSMVGVLETFGLLCLCTCRVLLFGRVSSV